MHRLFICLCSATLTVALALHSVPARADELDEQQIRDLLTEAALRHNVSPAMLHCVVQKESRFKPSARGTLREDGLAQWLPGSGNAWHYTSAYAQGIDIEREYAAWRAGTGGEHAPYYDADGLAELFARGRAYRHQHWPATIRGCE